jgi:hypothetical protein
MAAMTTTGGDSGNNHDFGTNGGQLLPNILPDNFSEIMQPFKSDAALPTSSTDMVTLIPIAKDYKELASWYIATATSGAITIVVKKNGTTIVTATQPSGTASNGTFTPVSLAAGDVLSYFITSNGGAIKLAAITLAAIKHWPQFPTYAAHP